MTRIGYICRNLECERILAHRFTHGIQMPTKVHFPSHNLNAIRIFVLIHLQLHLNITGFA